MTEAISPDDGGDLLRKSPGKRLAERVASRSRSERPTILPRAAARPDDHVRRQPSDHRFQAAGVAGDRAVLGPAVRPGRRTQRRQVLAAALHALHGPGAVRRQFGPRLGLYRPAEPRPGAVLRHGRLRHRLLAEAADGRPGGRQAVRRRPGHGPAGLHGVLPPGRRALLDRPAHQHLRGGCRWRCCCRRSPPRPSVTSRSAAASRASTSPSSPRPSCWPPTPSSSTSSPTRAAWSA